jgi:ankyrin repeat protein
MERTLKLALRYGANINTVIDPFGRTALAFAALTGQVNILPHLLEEGADTTICSRSGFTPLHHAARNGHTEIVMLLIRGGAEYSAISKEGTTPLVLA